ncbi:MULTISPECIES: Ecr family regulatory small membrane protein [Lelliottia]|nr:MULTISPECIES: Ecr family regulatory small membrane protein [Lelliottia]MBL5882606.1 Ecr family regulatory small membrane protein [Lelliottia aquatilis]
MGKTEVILILIILCVIISGLWFIFSGEMWHLVGFLESSLYPSINAPE